MEKYKSYSSKVLQKLAKVKTGDELDAIESILASRGASGRGGRCLQRHWDRKSRGLASTFSPFYRRNKNIFRIFVVQTKGQWNDIITN